MGLFGSERTLAVTVTAKVDAYVAALKQAEQSTTTFSKRVEAEGRRAEKAQKATGAAASVSAREQASAARVQERAAKQAAAAQEKATRKLEQESARKVALERKAAAASVRAAEEQRQAWQQVSQIQAAAGAALAASVGGVVATYARFDQQLSKVRAVSGASGDAMKALSDAALQAGKDTVFSASEAAQAEAELAKVGLNASQIIGGALNGALNLAAAGSITLADAAVAAGQTMKTFELGAKDVPAIADALAAGANKSAADVQDLTMALSQGGLVAHQTGMTMQQTIGVLSAFADNALMGSDAGTALKNMLIRLTAPTGKAAQDLAKLGISVYDANGQFVGITQVAGQWQAAMSQLTDEQRNMYSNTILGTDAIRAGNIMYRLGAEGIQQYVDGVTDAGAASRVAATQTDNLIGDFERLKGALETAVIQSGGGANGVLRDMTQALTGVVEAVDGLPGPLKETAVGVAAATAAVLLLRAGLTQVVIRSAEAKIAMETLGLSSGKMAGKVGAAAATLRGPWGLALTAGTIVLGAFASKHAKAKQAVEALTDAVRADSGAIGENTVMRVKQELETNGVGEAAKRLGVKFVDLAQASLGNADALTRVTASLDAYYKTVEASGGSTLVAEQDVNSLLGAIGAQKEKIDASIASYKEQQAILAGMPGATSNAAGGVRALGGALSDAADDASTADDRLKDFSQSLEDLYAQTFGVAEAEDRFAGSLQDMAKQAKESHGKVRGNSEAARDLRAAMRDAFQESLNVVDAFAKTGASSDKVAEKTAAVKRKFLDQARAAGISRDEVLKYAAAFDHVPREASTTIKVNGIDAAARKIASLSSDIRNIPSLQAAIHTAYGSAPKKAQGGLIPGPPSTADTVPAYLSTGEYVVRASAVQRLGVQRLDHMNATGTVPAFATGGLVSPARLAAGGQVTATHKWTPAAAVGSSTGGRVVVEEHHHHYHLDGAAVAGTARAYAAEVGRVQARRARNAERYGSARS